MRARGIIELCADFDSLATFTCLLSLFLLSLFLLSLFLFLVSPGYSMAG